MVRIRELRLMSLRFLCASSWALGALAALSASIARAQASSSEVPTPAERARLFAGQSQPRKEVPFNPADFDKFAGYYTQGDPVAFLQVFRTGDHYYAQINSTSPTEFLPDSPTEFFATKGTAQITFVTGPDGRVTEMINHQNGYLRPWARSSKSAYDAFETSLKQRIAENIPSPGAETAIRRQIEEGERTGHLLYAQMTPLLAANYREHSAQFEETLKHMGTLQSLRFVKVWPPNGHDEYLATFAHGQLAVVTAPLTPDGKMTVLELRAQP